MKATAIIFFLTFLTGAFAQSHQFTGRVIDEKTGEGLPFAKVVLQRNGELKYAVVADVDGRFLFNAVVPGSYTLEIRFIGYKTISQTITIHSGDIGLINLELKKQLISICILDVNIIASDKSREVGAPPNE